jgi:hypothetical protein
MSSVRDVEARTATYRRDTERGPATFVAYATPALRPAESVNATVTLAAERDTAALIGDVQTVDADVNDVTRVGNRTVTLLGNQTTLRAYEATATVGGRRVDVTIYRASVRYGDDNVSVPVVAPAGVDERERVRSLVGAVSHEK